MNLWNSFHFIRNGIHFISNLFLFYIYVLYVPHSTDVNMDDNEVSIKKISVIKLCNRRENNIREIKFDGLAYFRKLTVLAICEEMSDMKTNTFLCVL